MKTFSEFIFEAENASSKIAQLRARARMLRQKGDIKGALEVEKQAGELQAGTQAKISSQISSDKKDKPERKNTWTSGYASKPADTRGSSGSLPNISSPSGENPGTSTGGRYGDRRSGRSGGVRGQIRNNATARNLGHLGTKSN